MTGGEECDGDVCITCSDAATPVTVLEVRDDATALVDTGVGVEEVSVALVEAVVGGVVLVHAGEAIAVLDAGGAPPPAAGTSRSARSPGPG